MIAFIFIHIWHIHLYQFKCNARNQIQKYTATCGTDAWTSLIYTKVIVPLPFIVTAIKVRALLVLSSLRCYNHLQTTWKSLIVLLILTNRLLFSADVMTSYIVRTLEDYGVVNIFDNNPLHSQAWQYHLTNRNNNIFRATQILSFCVTTRNFIPENTDGNPYLGISN